jgi:hypothetical protein
MILHSGVITHCDISLGNIEIKIAVLVAIGLSFIPALTALHLVAEGRAKNLQILSGHGVVSQCTSCALAHNSILRHGIHCNFIVHYNAVIIFWSS